MELLDQRFVELLYHSSLFLRRYLYFTEKRITMFSSLLFLQEYHNDYVKFSKIIEFSTNIHGNEMKLKYQSFRNLFRQIKHQLSIGEVLFLRKIDGEYALKCSDNLFSLVNTTDSRRLMIDPDAYDEYKNIAEYII